MSQKIKLNVYSSATSVAGQGVGSAYLEQVNLIKEGAPELFDIAINNWTRKADIQHFHTIDPSFLLKMKGSNAVNVAYCHFLPDTVFKGSLKLPGPIQSIVSSYIIEFYKSADYIVVVNPTFGQQLTQYGIPAEKIHFVPNYVSHKKFHSLGNAKRIEYRKKYSIKEDAFVVLGAGQAQTRKGVFDFLEVAKMNPDYYFVWVGGFSFGPMTDGYEELKKLMKHPPKNVLFTGIIEREEMVCMYNMCDVLFIPSYNELFPMTILEAANLDIPMLIRDLDLYKDILFDHYLRGSTNEEFSNILQNLKDDPELYRKYQQESHQISLYYSKEHVLEMWKDFYLKIYREKLM